MRVKVDTPGFGDRPSHPVTSMLLRHDVALQLVLAAFMLLYYGALITNGNFHFFHPTRNGLTFNSMIEHLLAGRFDVDPETVGNEGFLRNGHVYAYWGIFCAVIRLPLLAFKGGSATDVTTASCLIAVCLTGIMKIRTALFVRRFCQPGPLCESVFLLLLIYIVLGGAQVGYLRVSIYQEVVFWAAAMASGFVYCAVRGVILGRFTLGLLAVMALLAALALLNRVSTGMGLYAATGLLLAVLVVGDARADNHPLAGRLLSALLSRRVVAACAILLAGVVLTGAVNYFRWGNPATFADFSLYLFNRLYPDRLARTAEYGLFNIARIPFGLVYYFVPIWVLQAPDGTLLFDAARTRLIDAAELPPGSFFLTDLLPILFSAFLFAAMLRRHVPRLIPLGQILALATGLAVPCVLMLMAISMNYRYRMEFYPEIDLLAFLGFYAATSRAEALASVYRYRRWITAATLVSVLSAHGELILYKLSGFGPGQDYLRHGILRYYYWHVLRIIHTAGLMH
jgi:hypothetical protein